MIRTLIHRLAELATYHCRFCFCGAPFESEAEGRPIPGPSTASSDLPPQLRLRHLL
ncbi:hypothetical protein V2W30_09160 [Streptomyces sp. Q6]|uniref:Uncharacterized protein n=1 Tax=Streptomyces citrinus TaxID=3118173 RepID=A0ACD5AC97_9ACTN